MQSVQWCEYFAWLVTTSILFCQYEMVALTYDRYTGTNFKNQTHHNPQKASVSSRSPHGYKVWASLRCYHLKISIYGSSFPFVPTEIIKRHSTANSFVYLLCNDTCSATGGRITYWREGAQTEKILFSSYSCKFSFHFSH